MAYYINGKAFTDHPLMDEIVYNCKLILNGIVIKNDVLANMSETDNSINNAEILFLQTETGGDISFELFVFSEEILLAYGYTESEAKAYAKDKNKIPEADRVSLTAFANQYFRDNFTEENNYYRMLNGLPPFDSGEIYYIWLTSSDIPSDYVGEVDLSLPLHEQDRDLINALYVDGVIDKLRKIYPGSNYSYMNYLGEKKIDIYTARKAGKWDILYMPNIYYLIEDRFTELYKINRETYINRSYQEYFAQTGKYYDQMMIVILLCQTFADLVTDIPEWYIRRDIFDIKTCKFFLESYGVAYFKEIPLKYQIRIVKNLNRLIFNKSSMQNLDDILDIFNIDGANIFKYWLYKKPVGGGFDLEFIQSNYKESYDNYIKDTKYRTPYDSITLYDKYWDGDFDHDYVKNKILEKDFTIQGTKYMSVEYNIDMSEYMYEMEYMLGLILDSNNQESLSEIRIGIPSIDETAQFKISDIFLFLVILTNEYYQFSSEVKYPPNSEEGPVPEYVDECEDYEKYDWLKRVFPEIFVLKNGRVYGFNSDLDLDKLISYIKDRRHSNLRFGAPDEIGMEPLDKDEYAAKCQDWLDDIGVTDYMIPKDIYDINTLVKIYKNNTKIYNKVKESIYNATDHNDKKLLEYIFQELFTREYDFNMYNYTDEQGVTHTYENLIDMLKDRNFVLYEAYLDVVLEGNIDSKRDMLRGIMNDILDTMEYYLSTDGLEYIYSFVAINSPSAIAGYLYNMFDFFKSFKVYFLDPYYTLFANDKLENSSKALDRFSDYNIINYWWDSSNVCDCIAYFQLQLIFDDHYDWDIFEETDIYAYYDPDPLLDLDFDGIHAEDGESVTKEIDGGEADSSHCIPYIEANGGSAYLGVPNFSNIDGGEADEFDREYFDVDGGYPFNEDDIKTDEMGSANFNYEIDGGGAAKRRYITNSMDIQLIGTEIVAEVRISSLDECIEIKDDGVCIEYGAITTYNDFNNLKTLWNNVVYEVQQANLNTIQEALEIIGNPIEKIHNIVNVITGDITYAVWANTDDNFSNMIKGHVDGLVDALNTEFNDSAINVFTIEEI